MSIVYRLTDGPAAGGSASGRCALLRLLPGMLCTSSSFSLSVSSSPTTAAAAAAAAAVVPAAAAAAAAAAAVVAAARAPAAEPPPLAATAAVVAVLVTVLLLLLILLPPAACWLRLAIAARSCACSSTFLRCGVCCACHMQGVVQ
jgi:hypothetical protein